ncbi:MAG: glycosyltransferase family 4 protein [Chloroflexota bacterium]
MRIAILHFTALPAIGGIENLMLAQQRALLSMGETVRLIVAGGQVEVGVEMVHLPLLHPAHPTVVGVLNHHRVRTAGGSIPQRNHPLVQALVDALRAALQDCDQCWVHNAFTVYLNPFLTVALVLLARELRLMTWVAWCEDLSMESADWPQLTRAERVRVSLPPAVRVVTISHARARKLSTLLGRPESGITVMPPPFDAMAWLSPADEAREIIETLSLLERSPLVLVPSKLLPHKNLELSVEVAKELRRIAPLSLLLITGATSPHQPRISEAVRGQLTRRLGETEEDRQVQVLSSLLGRPPTRQTVFDLMRLAGVMLLLSRDEGYGTAITEALACRVPLVCSDIPAFREAAGAAAHYVSAGEDPGAIASSILAITDSPAGQKHHEALLSMSRFQTQVKHLLLP